jgi:hypothetical protein
VAVYEESDGSCPHCDNYDVGISLHFLQMLLEAIYTSTTAGSRGLAIRCEVGREPNCPKPLRNRPIAACSKRVQGSFLSQVITSRCFLLLLPIEVTHIDICRPDGRRNAFCSAMPGFGYSEPLIEIASGVVHILRRTPPTQVRTVARAAIEHLSCHNPGVFLNPDRPAPLYTGRKLDIYP